MKKAVVLLSGGMDSAVTLYSAKQDHECHVLIFYYGQKADKEIEFAQKLAEESGCEYIIMNISLPWKGSALLDDNVSIPDAQEVTGGDDIPATYVPARNIIFLSYGVSYAEAIDADAVFIGAHQLDFSNYPDCRSSFFDKFREAVKEGTKRGHEGKEVKIVTPVIDKTKKEIVELGAHLGVPFERTWSCYRNEEKPCGKCESCYFRAKAFKEAGVKDPLNSGKGKR